MVVTLTNLSRTARYKADLAGVALKPQESRVIASWLLGRHGKPDNASWRDLIYVRNDVEIKGLSTLRRQSNLIRARLTTLSEDWLALIADGSFRETEQACLAACIKHSVLLGDFLNVYIRQELAKKNRYLDSWHWRRFLDDCHQRDPEMSEWSMATVKRIQTSVYGILKDTGILVSEKNLFRIEKVIYEPAVIALLESLDEEHCLQCMRYDQ